MGYTSPMKSCLAIGALVIGLIIAGVIGWALTAGGYRLSEDPELEMAGAWARAFRDDAPPELSREIGKACTEEIGRSPWTRDGSLALFNCIRRKGEAAGYSYTFDEEPAAPAA